MDPFFRLVELEKHCKAKSEKLLQQIVAARDWVGIGFKASNFNFVCPIDALVEILPWESSYSIPASVSWFKGNINLRGKLLSITDLAGFITGKNSPEVSKSRVLVVRYQGALHGFGVSVVLGIQHFFREEVKSVETLTNLGDYLSYSIGGFEQEGVRWVILSFEKIIESTPFYYITHTQGHHSK